MAAPTTTSGGLSTIPIATLTKYLRTAADNITNGPGLMRHMKRKKLIRSEELTGPQQQVPIDRGDNTNGQWFDDADSWQIRPNTELIDSYVGYYNFRTGFSISDVEQLENASEQKIFDLLDLRMKVCKRAMTIALSQAVVGAQGSDTKKFPGIRDLFGGSTPTSNSTYQGLSSATYTWWKPDVQVVSTGLGPNYSGLRTALQHQFANLKLKLGAPSVGITEQLGYEAFLASSNNTAETYGYPSSIRGPEATVGKIESGSSPVPDLMWRGVEIIFDEYVAVPSSYTSTQDFHFMFIDSESYFYKVDPRWNFKLIKPRERAAEDTQWVSHYALAFRATSICFARRAHGITVFDLG